MDVRCAQCQAEYELDDTLVAERGTAVCCTRCGFRFRAYRPANTAAAPERWVVRTGAGETLTFLSLRDLQEAIVLRRVGPQDALTRGSGPARSLASIVEFRALFEAAKRGGDGLAKARPSMPTPAGLGQPSRPSFPLGLGGALTPPKGANAAWAENQRGVTLLGTGPGVLPVPAGFANSALVGDLAPEIVTPPEGVTTSRPGAPTDSRAGGSVTDSHGGSVTDSRGGAALPSMVRTIPFGKENEKLLREAVEAALGRKIEGAPKASDSGPVPTRQVYEGETTAPLFTGTASGRDPASGGQGGVVVNASTPQAFSNEMMTPSGGHSRPPEVARVEGRPSGVPAWEPTRPPRTPALRWFVVIALAMAFGAGLALHRGLMPAGRPPERAPTKLNAAQLDGLLASADEALGRGDFDAALETYAKAKAVGVRDTRVVLGFARASVLRAEGPWWRLRLLPEMALGARATASDELAEWAAKSSKAVEEAAGAAAGDSRVLSLRVDVRRLQGDLPAARAFVAPLSADSSADAAYTWGALRLAEGAPFSAETLRLLREAAAGEGVPGRASAALVYALALTGEGQAARAEIERVKAFAALPELRAWLEARADKAPERPVASAEGRAPRRPPPPPPPRPRSTAVPAPTAAREPGSAAEPKGALNRTPGDASGSMTSPKPAGPAPVDPGGAPDERLLDSP